LAKVPLIAVIDDDKSVRDSTNGLVRSLGYATATFASAEEYLCSDRVRDTTCVITDLQMPGLSGADLQRQLITEGHRTPVIVVTAFPDEKMKTRVLNAGAFGFLSKPFDDERLIECLHRALAAA
jgi:FixJ family two-component response regulator